MGAEIFLISDLHLGHKNMAIHRGFQDEFEMNELIISNWNKVVAKHDTVWILGDITNEKSIHYYLLDQLNGYKKVVLGNHDMPQHVPELLKYVNKVCGVTELKEYWLTHIPMHPSELYNNEINIHGHCVDATTEILTKKGWKKYNELCVNDIIYSLNPNTQELEYDNINTIIINENYTGSMYNFIGKGLDMLVTDKHRIPYLTGGNKFNIIPANEFFNRSIATIFKSFNFKNEGINLSDNLLKLYIYLAADGNITNKTLCRFSFHKERKVILVEKLLNDLEIKYSKNKSKGITRINFQMPIELYDWNIKGLDIKLLNVNKQQAQIIKESYSETDGYANIIFTSKRIEVDILQHLFILNGFSCKVHSRDNHGFSKKTSYQLSVTDNSTQLLTYIKKRVKLIENFNNLVWCITCNNGNFIARRNGSVFLTGNCHETPLEDYRYVNVSCEQVNYTPVKFSLVKHYIQNETTNYINFSEYLKTIV